MSFQIKGQEIYDPSKISISIEQDFTSLSLNSLPTVSIKIVNHSEESFDRVFLSCEHFDIDRNLLELIEGIEMTDPNGNGILEPNEKWTSSQIIDDTSLSSILGASLIAANNEKSYIAADACLLRRVGMNIDVYFESDAAAPGDLVDVQFIVRLLIDENAAKEPGVIVVNGISIPLPRTHWEMRNIQISIDGFNNDSLFFATQIPKSIPLIPFCDQEVLDAGRNTDGVIDECEPINTVRPPCSDFGEDEIACEFPDWVFCMSIQIPENLESGDIYTLTARDSAQFFMAEEDPPQSDIFADFIDITAMLNPITVDTDSIQILNVSSNDVPEISEYSIAPNPFRDQLKLDSPDEVWVEMYDYTGTLHLALSSEALNSAQLSHLPSGGYMIIIKEEASGQVIKYEKLIKI